MLFIILVRFAYTLVFEGKSCRESNKSDYIGKVLLEVCVATCRVKSTVFLHGFKEGVCSPEGCKCYCISGAAENGTCNYYPNERYKLYKYMDQQAVTTAGKCLINESNTR